ncbi:MAG: hypothetical protein II336_18030 [Loktanella sp.]|nr:hypothetical protein [Loktanella sp.]
MTTAKGRAHCISRLSSCPDIDALARVWSGLGKSYQIDDEVSAFKDKMKKQLSQGPDNRGVAA